MTPEELEKRRIYYREYFQKPENREKRNKAARDRYKRITKNMTRQYKKWKVIKNENTYYENHKKRLKKGANDYYKKNREIILLKNKMKRFLKKGEGILLSPSEKKHRKYYFKNYYLENKDNWNKKRKNNLIEKKRTEIKKTFTEISFD